MELRVEKIENLLLKIIEKLNFQQKEILNLEEVVELTTLKKSYIYKLNHEGKIPSYSFSDKGKLFFKKAEIQKWMTKNKRFYKEDVERDLGAIFT